MKSAEIILKTLYYERKRFVLKKELEDLCKEHGINLDSIIKYFLERGYFIRVFRGIFYIRDPSEIKLKYILYSAHEMIAEGMRFKGIDNWYFGMYSGLKYNNMTHEYFTSDFIINDSIYREKPMKMNDAMFKFVKMKPSMFEFGVITEKTKNNITIRYSDKEKTVMDFAYLWKRNGKNISFIVSRVAEYINQLDIEKMKKYAKHYPKWMEKLIGNLNG
jgi:hypothetical protein